MLREKKLVCWASEELHRRDVNDANANAVVVTSKADGVPAPLTDRYLSLIKAFCPAPRLQVGFFSPLLSWPSNRSQFPSLFSWLPCSPVQVSAPPAPPLPPCAPLPAHAGADNKGVHRGISAAAKAQRGARPCERSTHAEVTHLVVTRQVAG